MTNTTYRIAVVGGGISGLYCALELQRRLTSTSIKCLFGEPDNVIVTLYEATERVGGKIESWPFDYRPGIPAIVESTTPTADTFVAEFGPMRIEPAHQPRLAELLKSLHITEPGRFDEKKLKKDLTSFPSYQSATPLQPQFTLSGEEADQKSLLDLLLLAVLRICELIAEDKSNSTGQRIPAKRWGPKSRARAYELWDQFLGNSSVRRRYWKGELHDWIRAIGDGEYDEIRDLKLNGIFLRDMGFWNMLSEVLSHLAVVKIRDWGSYYHAISENPNAAEQLIFWLRALKTSNELHGIRGGMEQIVDSIKSELNNPRVTLNTKHILKSLSSKSAPEITLNFSKQNDDGSWDNDIEEVADEVILALPKHALQKLNLPLEITQHLDDVMALPLLKLFFVIDKPWWEDQRPPNTSVGDIPTRELYYWKNRDGTHGVIMIYTDTPALHFWADYLPKDAWCEQHRAYKWIRTDHVRDGPPDNPEIKRLIKRFVQFARDYQHDDFDEDRVLAVGIRDWGREPFEGAFHLWRPRVDSRQIINILKAFSLSSPNGRNNVHIVGEAYSDHQGFIEGALRSSEQTLSTLIP